MVVPTAPFVPHTTIINKTIVYSDTVLPLKDKGSNLIVTSISNVNESSLENCLKTIFESNPNIVFNTIQYSKNDKKVYFYTDKEITTNVYEDSKFTTYKPITSRAKILEEEKRVLVAPKNKDSNCISLYDISLLLRKFRSEYDAITKRYNLSDIVKLKFNDWSDVVVYDFDYENEILKIGFKMYNSEDYAEICFAKQNGDLYIVKSKSCWTNEVFEVLSSKLYDMYDELLKHADYKDNRKSKYCIKAVNSNFCVNISHYGVGIFVKSFTNRFMNEFKLFAPSYSMDYTFECNSSIVHEAFNDKEDEIFKRIFVKISDCPEWSQAMLYEIRQNQLAEEQKNEYKIKYREMRKAKRLALTGKIFPF